ncbi:hypothetical protein HMPREF1531_00981 [Propionibacterium sp. oral taxon 192 str. F0372]|uniref:hypothetical protein n=1 Tax=Propionibacterium sp. oral taxon 192 TaxID=671222 RepID=UPI0003543B4A|nr:hypothetical protein [Propionibacterium sp. oral taxon 192]EPH05552.1 hypothetical protein HMPREF1531_00981 [Propionibacterium sp. oral taxon 192 str. F0372]
MPDRWMFVLNRAEAVGPNVIREVASVLATTSEVAIYLAGTCALHHLIAPDPIPGTRVIVDRKTLRRVGWPENQVPVGVVADEGVIADALLDPKTQVIWR